MLLSERHINCTDQSVRLSNLNQYDIAIQIVSDGFSFVVYDSRQRKYVALADVASSSPCEALLAELGRRKWVLSAFRKVRVVADSPFRTLVPTALYDEGAKEKYLKFVYDLPANVVVGADRLRCADAVMVRATDKAVAERFAGFPFYGQAAVLVESLAVECKNLTDAVRVFVDVKADSFDMIVFENGKLLFFNNFKYNTKEDFIYFVLFAMEQQNLNPETAPVFLTGMVDQDSDLLPLAERYIRDLRFVTRGDGPQCAYRLEEVPYHYHYTLYNILQCEL